MAAPAVGHRFQPTDEELITYYLKKVISRQPLMRVEESYFIVKELYGDKATPWELLSDDLPWHDVVESSVVVHSQKVLFVFTVLSSVGKENPKNKQPKNRNRVAGCGTWHANASAKPIIGKLYESGKKIGESKSFTFSSPVETVGHWTMTEYSIDAAANGLPEVEGIDYSNYVLCKIKRDDSKSSKDGKIVCRKRKFEASSEAEPKVLGKKRRRTTQMLVILRKLLVVYWQVGTFQMIYLIQPPVLIPYLKWINLWTIWCLVVDA